MICSLVHTVAIHRNWVRIRRCHRLPHRRVTRWACRRCRRRSASTCRSWRPCRVTGVTTVPWPRLIRTHPPLRRPSLPVPATATAPSRNCRPPTPTSGRRRRRGTAPDPPTPASLPIIQRYPPVSDTHLHFIIYSLLFVMYFYLFKSSHLLLCKFCKLLLLLLRILIFIHSIWKMMWTLHFSIIIIIIRFLTSMNRWLCKLSNVFECMLMRWAFVCCFNLVITTHSACSHQWITDEANYGKRAWIYANEMLIFVCCSVAADGIDGAVGQHEHGRHEHEHEYEHEHVGHVGHVHVGHRSRLRHERREQGVQRPVPAARPASQASRPLHPGAGPSLTVQLSTVSLSKDAP